MVVGTGNVRYYIGMKEKKNDGVFCAIQLALLEKSEEEEARFSGEVEKILAFVSDVQSVDTKAVSDVDSKTNVFRDDAVTVEAGIYREHMLAQAPNTFKKWFLSKKIL